MKLLNRTFTAQSVALATGSPAKQITDWCNMGRVVGQREPVGRGKSRQFSWFNVMEIAIAAELMDMGMTSVHDAFSAAQLFAHASSGATGWAGDDGISEDDDKPHRWPGLPFHHEHGVTFLLIWKGRSDVQLADPEGNVNLLQFPPLYSRTTGIIAVNVSEIFARVCHRMALDYREVLDEAYSKDA